RPRPPAVVFGLLLRTAMRGRLAPASGRHPTTSRDPRDEALHSSGRRRSRNPVSESASGRSPSRRQIHRGFRNDFLAHQKERV
ncbi:MAG: hypothetical protein P8127_09395, partial [Acidobacteriota bacterium]